MNIPHQEPIKFAQEIIFVDENTVKVRCHFPEFPTLSMLFEAAAQSSAAFSIREKRIGFIISLKNILLLKEINSYDFIANIEKSIEFGNICEFNFFITCLENKVKYAQGTFTLLLEE